MPFDSEAESQASLSSPSQKFVPQEDDEETLWEVIEITAEKGNTYKVRWKGNDPKTMKPWPQSWVKKTDCTDDLVMEWKRKKKEKDRRKSSKGGRDSTASKKAGRASTSTVGISKASSSKLPLGSISKSTRRSTSTTTATGNGTAKATTLRHGRSSATIARETATLTPIASRAKRTKPDPDGTDEDIDELDEDEPPQPRQTHPTSAAISTKTQGTKRKLADATSAHSSANHVQHGDFAAVDINVDEDGAPIKKGPTGRPKKKRKVEVETVKPEPESEMESQRSLTQPQPQPQISQEESYEIRKVQGKVTIPDEEEEEEEERMVEDALSEASPPREFENYDGGYDDEMGQASREQDVEEEEKEDGIIISKPKSSTQHHDEQGSGQTKNATTKKPTSTASKPAHLFSKSVSLADSRSPSAAATKDKGKGKEKAINIRSSSSVSPPASPTPPPSVQMKFGPPSKKRSLATSQKHSDATNSFSKSKSKDIDNVASAVTAKPPPVKTTKKRRLGSHPTRSAHSGSDSDLGSPPSLEWPAPEATPNREHRAPTEERSVFWDGGAAEGAAQHEPVLSPGALKRLERFDEEVMGIRKRGSTIHQELEKDGAAKETSELRFKPDESSPLIISMKAKTPRASEGKEKEKERLEQHSEQPLFLPGSSPISGPQSEARALERAEAVDSANAQEDRRSVASKNSKRSDEAKSDSKSSKSKPKSTSSANTATTSNNALPRRSANPPKNSYATDVVPETESESHSQEVKEPAQPPSTPSGKPGLKSRMKLRTPGADSRAVSKQRSLRPIPVLSPSTFHPLLPELDSSLPESITDIPEHENRLQNSNLDSDTEDEDGPMSSIEQFESPEKRKGKTTMLRVVARKEPSNKGKGKERSTGSVRESASDIWESEVVKRGQEIAEAAKKRAGSRSSSPNARPKKTIADIVTQTKTRSRSRSNLSATSPEREVRRHSPVPEEDEDHDMAGVSTNVAPPASWPRASLDDENLTLHEMEKAYVDLGGGAEDMRIDHDASVPHTVDPKLLRQEEEESTQDLMMDLQQVQQHRPLDTTAGWAVKPMSVLPAIAEAVSEETQHDEENSAAQKGQDASLRAIPEIVVQNPSRATSVQSFSAEEDHPPPPPVRMTRSRSRSKTPSVVNHPVASQMNGKKPKSSSAQSSKRGSVPPVQPLVSQKNETEVESRHLTAALNAKSEEVAKLEADLASERAKNAEFLQEVLSLRPQVAQLNELQTKHLQSMTAVNELANAIQSMKTKWETEKAQLVEKVESANRGKVDAEKDREFFREQYAKASGYVSSVRDENKDLEKRVKIAEDQTQSGLSLVKATFELRVKTLEDDLKAWRKMAEFLIEKDRRSNNDDIRRRAAEEPELRAQCERQAIALAQGEEHLNTLEAELEEKTHAWNDSEAELQRWRNETTRLHVELNEAMTKLDRIGRGGDYDDESADMSGNGHEFVYSCKWRTDHNESCREVFSTISELERHLVSAAGHLQST